MKLMTKEIEGKMPGLYSQEFEENPKIIIKFFCPWNNWTWYVTEGEKDENGDWRFFGLVDGHFKELGYFTLSEMEKAVGPHGYLKIERDKWFGFNHRLDEFKEHAYIPDEKAFDLFIKYTLANPGKKLTYEDYLKFKKENK